MTRYVLCVSFLACARAPPILDQQLEFADHNIRLKHVFPPPFNCQDTLKQTLKKYEKILNNPASIIEVYKK